MASSGLRPKSTEDSEQLQNLYNQVWAAFAKSNPSNDGDLDNIYGGYADDHLNDPAPPSPVTSPQTRSVSYKGTYIFCMKLYYPNSAQPDFGVVRILPPQFWIRK